MGIQRKLFLLCKAKELFLQTLDDRISKNEKEIKRITVHYNP